MTTVVRDGSEVRPCGEVEGRTHATESVPHTMLGRAWSFWAVVAIVAAFIASACAAPKAERGRERSAASSSEGSRATVGLPFELDEPVYGNGGGSIRAIRVDGLGTSLVVWTVNGEVFGARIDAGGTVLDPEPIRVSRRPFPGTGSCDVSFDGTNWLVVWSGGAARVGPDGVVLDPEGIPIGTGNFPAVAYVGGRWLIVSVTDSWTISGVRVDSNGALLDPTPIVIGRDSNPGLNHPKVASNGTDWLVVWQGVWGFDQLGTINLARVSADGRVADPAQILSEDRNLFKPAVASDGTSWLVGWQGNEVSSAPRLYAARVSATGALLDPNGAVLPATFGTGPPALSHDGTNWLVIWSDGANLLGRRLDANGQRVDPLDSVISAVPGDDIDDSPDASFNGVDWVITWIDRANGMDFARPKGARLASDGTVLDPSGLSVAVGKNHQGVPAIAANGASFLVVWSDRRRGGASDIYGARVGLGGAVLDSRASFIVGDAMNPAVAASGATWLVVWEDARSGPDSYVYGARVSASGALLDPGGIPISTVPSTGQGPSVCGNGREWLVTWEDGRNGGSDVYGARVSAEGVVQDPQGIALSSGNGSSRQPVATWNGSSFLVAMSHASGLPDWDIRAVRVSEGGAVLDPMSIPVSTAPEQQGKPSTFSNQGMSLVVWPDFRSYDTLDAFGSRVTADGAVLDPSGLAIRTSPPPFSEAPVSVAGDGLDWLVVWGWRNNVTGSAVEAARVDSSGALDPMLPIADAITEDVHLLRDPAVAGNARGEFLIAYVAVQGLNQRVKARFVTLASGEGGGAGETSGGAPGEGGSGGDEGGGTGGTGVGAGNGGAVASSGRSGGGTGGGLGGGSGRSGAGGASPTTGGSSGHPNGGEAAGEAGAQTSGGNGGQPSEAGSGGTHTPRGEEGCGCAVPRSRSATSDLLGMVTAILALAARRRRRDAS